MAAGVISLVAIDGATGAAASFTAVSRPDVLALVSAPTDGAWVGAVATTPFALRVLKADGVTPDPSQTVVISVTGGSASLGGCASICSLISDVNGLVSVPVTPLAAGTVMLLGTLGNSTQSVSFLAAVRPDVVSVLSSPGNGALVGDVAAGLFTVQVRAGDGVTVGAGRSVTLSVTNGSATFMACNSASCALVADGQGKVTSWVVPGSAGAITLLAVDGNVTAAVTFNALAKPDGLVLVSSPANGSWVGSVAAVPFAVRVLKGDGVTPDVGRSVAVTVSAGSAVLTGAGVSDGNGLVSIGVTPLAAGSISLTAALGSMMQTATFTAAMRPDTMQVVSVPANGALVGDVAGAVFAVRVFAGDGSAAVGRSVTLSVTNGECGPDGLWWGSLYGGDGWSGNGAKRSGAGCGGPCGAGGRGWIGGGDG